MFATAIHSFKWLRIQLNNSEFRGLKTDLCVSITVDLHYINSNQSVHFRMLRYEVTHALSISMIH